MKTRDVIYMIYNENEQSVTSMGIEFIDFISSLRSELDNILLLTSGYTGENFHNGLKLEYVTKENLSELYKEDVYSYGDFCWIDFEDEASLDTIEPKVKAELLYLGHYQKPLNSSFFNQLNNKFAYLAHDDGWYNKIYCRDKYAYTDVLRNLIPNKLKPYRKKAQALSEELGQQLLHMAKEGLLIDLYRTIKTRTGLEIPFNLIGKMINFDDVYNNMDRYKAMVKKEYWLIYKNQEWTISPY